MYRMEEAQMEEAQPSWLTHSFPLTFHGRHPIIAGKEELLMKAVCSESVRVLYISIYKRHDKMKLNWQIVSPHRHA